MSVQSQSRRPFRRFRFTLRALLVFTALVSIWMGFKVNAVRRQQAVVAELSKREITFYYDHQHDALLLQQLPYRGTILVPMYFPCFPKTSPQAPLWLRYLIGDDYFQSVTAVMLVTHELSELKAVMPLLKQLPDLEEVFIPSAYCGLVYPDFVKAKDFLERELPKLRF